jgi:hypothetical protein
VLFATVWGSLSTGFGPIEHYPTKTVPLDGLKTGLNVRYQCTGIESLFCIVHVAVIVHVRSMLTRSSKGLLPGLL